MRIAAWLKSSPLMKYYSPNTFKITLIDKCRFAILTPIEPVSNLLEYNLGDPTFSLSLPFWTHNIPDDSCDPLIYTAKLIDPFTG